VVRSGYWKQGATRPQTDPDRSIPVAMIFSGLLRFRPTRAALRVLALAALTLPCHAAEYHVSPAGNDGGDGSAGQPFRTIQRAVDAAQAGGRVVIAEGLYRESVRARPGPGSERRTTLRLEAAPKAQVIILGTDPSETEWVARGAGVWETNALEPVSALFSRGAPLTEARWPNLAGNDPFRQPRARAKPGTGYESLVSPELPVGDWSKGRMVIWPGSEWYGRTVPIRGYRPGRSLGMGTALRPDEPDRLHGFDPRVPRAGNPYFLVGAPDGVDAEGEWAWDPVAKLVRIRLKEQNTPDQLGIEVHRRVIGLSLQGAKGVEVQGIHLVGCGVDLRDATDCVLTGVHVWHPTHPGQWKDAPAAVRVSGERNRLNGCSITGSAFSAVELRGSSHAITDCLVRDSGFLGTGSAAIDMDESWRAEIRTTSVVRAGAGLISFNFASGFRIVHNELAGANQWTHDTGAVKCWSTDAQGGEIAYNWVHDNRGALTTGIYLDNFSRNVRVHHNVIWGNSGPGIALNSDANDHLIANNTVLNNGGGAFSTYTYPRRRSSQRGTFVVNNLIQGRADFVRGGNGPWLERNGSHALDKNRVPAPGSGAIDAGQVIKGINDQFIGKAPDIGAYEYGAPRWVPGVSFSAPRLRWPAHRPAKTP
jgi:parallel beta-helix repeat protein